MFICLCVYFTKKRTRLHNRDITYDVTLLYTPDKCLTIETSQTNETIQTIVTIESREYRNDLIYLFNIIGLQHLIEIER